MNGKQMLTSMLHTVQMGQSGIQSVKNYAIGPELKRQLHKQQQEYHIGDRPCAAARYEFDEFVHFRLTLRKYSSSLSF